MSNCYCGNFCSVISLFVFQRAYTSAPGEGGVVSFKDYDRKFSSHAVSYCYLHHL